MKLITITGNAQPGEAIGPLPPIAAEAAAATGELYADNGYSPPWVGYLGVENGECVGTCAFKAPAAAGRVEIAYYTFPPHEGKGVATRMASELIRIARETEPNITITAETLPEYDASTAVLERLGFRRAGAFEHPEDGTIWRWELDA